MSTLRLILKEITHRKINFLFGLLAVITAVALFTAFFTAGLASNRETARLMRDIGFNLRIIPRQTDMNHFLIAGFSEHTIPLETTPRILAVFRRSSFPLCPSMS